MLTRYKGQLKLKDWAFAIADDQRCAKRESPWLAASRSLCTRCCETERSSRSPKPRKPRGQEARSSSQEERRPREGADNGANFVARGQHYGRLRFQPSRAAPSFTPIKCRTSTRGERRHPKASTPRRASRP